jgi:(R,R)-butanediol dehydrogenase/meso-butanediol dehydrogenase/diacetyl reductase
MRAAVLQKKSEPLAIVDLDDPTPGPGELLVRVDSCGICGSDLHFSDSYELPGLVLGHEFSGTVADRGPDVEGWATGTPLTALSVATCGRCDACLSGRVRKCQQASMIGIERPGAYAEYLTVPAHNALALPDGFDTAIGALIEPLAVGLHAIERGRVAPYDDVLVIGAGPVGLAVIAWLEHLGVRSFVASAPSAARRDLASRLGAAVVDPSADDVASRFAELTGRPPSVVIECVGVPGLLQQAVDHAAIDATVVIAGVCMQPDDLVPIIAMTKELDLRFAFYYRQQDFDYAIDAIHRGRFDPRPLVTSEVGLDDLPARFDELKTPASHADAKVLVRP